MCTNFKMKPAVDGTIVVGRSMEFPNVVPYSLSVLPVGYAGTALPKDGVAGKSWTGTYGVVGIAGLGHEGWLTDGMNTEGLTGHILYMSDGFCVYQDFAGTGNDVSQIDVLAYLLTTCKTTAEVKAAVPAITIWGTDPGMGFVPPIHVLMHDATSSIAIELHPGGTVQIMDNPTGVGTNAPYLDWHLLNLQNYVGFNAFTPDPTAVDGLTIGPFGQGQGLNMIPGGYTPPDRFVRAAVLVQLASQPTDGKDAEQMVGHVLNAFDIIPGTVLEHMGGKVLSEETTYDAIFNLSDRRLTYRTVTDPTWYSVDLASVDFTKPARVQPLSMDGTWVSKTI